MPSSTSSFSETRSPIALMTRLDRQEEEVWRAGLAARLPEERIVSFAALTDRERSMVEIAVVANPEPRQVALLPRLAWIHSLWAGVERLVADLGDCAPPIVRLVDPELARTMAEAVLAWTYYLQRDMPTYRDQQRARCWRQLAYRPPSEVTVGLLGLGALGSRAGGRLREAGFAVKGWSRTEKQIAGIDTLSGEDGFAELLGASDILVCLLPLTAKTSGLLGARQFAMMKRGSALINFARGPILVEADLISALDAGLLSHAVLDVFDDEPLPVGSPVWDHSRITVLPHISAPTDRRTACAIVAANIRAYRASGGLPAAIDRSLGY